MPGSESRSPTPGRKGSTSKRPPARSSGGLQRRFVDALAWIITGAWGVSFVMDIVRPAYDPPGVLHALMLTVAGAAFGSTLIRREGE